MTDKPEKPTRALAMRAKCHDCSGGYTDGREDCGIRDCPLYPWMPYASDPPNLSWMEFNPKRVGKVKWEDSGKEMSDEDRAAAAHRLSLARTKHRKKIETIYDEELGVDEEEDDE